MIMGECTGSRQTHTYKKAIVKMPDGESKEIELSKWAKYAGDDGISILGKNGECIYTHLSNVVLIGD